MENQYIFNLTIEQETYAQDDAMFDEFGGLIGTVLSVEQLTMHNGNLLYTFDVESKKEIFEKLKFGKVKIAGLEDYLIADSAIVYRVKKDDTCC